MSDGEGVWLRGGDISRIEIKVFFLLTLQATNLFEKLGRNMLNH